MLNPVRQHRRAGSVRDFQPLDAAQTDCAFRLRDGRELDLTNRETDGWTRSLAPDGKGAFEIVTGDAWPAFAAAVQAAIEISRNQQLGGTPSHSTGSRVGDHGSRTIR